MDLYTICYGTSNIVSGDVIQKEKNVGGKTPVLVCQFRFNNNVEIPYSGGMINMKQKKGQE